jgi:hypothetical protein
MLCYVEGFVYQATKETSEVVRCVRKTNENILIPARWVSEMYFPFIINQLVRFPLSSFSNDHASSY